MPQLFSDEDKAAIVDAVASLDHLNRGKDTGAVIDMLQDAHPDLTREQLSNAWH